MASSPNLRAVRRGVLLALALVCAVLPRQARAETPYLLDEVSREVPSRGTVRCPAMPLTLYGGSVVPYNGQVTVHPAFVAKLRELEFPGMRRLCLAHFI